MPVWVLQIFLDLRVTGKAYLFLRRDQVKAVCRGVRIVTGDAALFFYRLMQITNVDLRFIFVTAYAKLFIFHKCDPGIISGMRVMTGQTLSLVRQRMPVRRAIFLLFLCVAGITELSVGCDCLQRVRAGCRFVAGGALSEC